jgi:glycosyltransferase involved in cell wall biosynthesis
VKLRIDSGNAPNQGGIGVYSEGLRNGLTRFASSDVVVCENAFRQYPRLARPVARLLYLNDLRIEANSNFGGADLVHFTNHYVPSRHPKVKYVGTIHDIDALTHPWVYPPAYRLYARRAFASVLERSSLILTDTNASRMKILSLYPQYDSKLRVAHVGLSERFMQLADQSKQLTTCGVPSLLFVGGLQKKKNCAWLVREVSKGIRSGAIPLLSLILAGNPGFGFAEIESEVNANSSIARIIRAPGLEEIVRLYHSCTAVVLPSVAEGFGIPLIESMYVNKPVVASRIPSSVEVASGACKFFDLGDVEGFYDATRGAIEDSHKADREQFIASNMGRFMWSNLIPDYVKTYKDALSA